jgi:hypothetical protein
VALALLAVPAAAAPQYTDKGELIPPTDYRDWVFLSSGLDMTTAPPARRPRTRSSTTCSSTLRPRSTDGYVHSRHSGR